MREILNSVPQPVNEPVESYAPNSPKRASLKKKLKEMSSEVIEIPCIIDGKEVRTGNTYEVRMPHRHKHVLARVHLAGEKELRAAADSAVRAQEKWASLEWGERVPIFLKAADLLTGPHRDIINASTMLGQSKNVYQAEIDAACEWIDFLKFNAYFYQELQKMQPLSVPGIQNSLDYRPLEGFVFAVTPFNFTSIAANLSCAPAMMGNTAVWKPSETQSLSAYYSMKLLMEAGLPAGVINFVPADGALAGSTLLPHRDLAGVHFTGSTGTFRTIYRAVAEHLPTYKSYPRLVGETGGKDFIFADASADPVAVAVAIVRGAFEYQGQKCSAASRCYIARSVWDKMKDRLIEDVRSIKMGDVEDFSNFMNAVIDERSFKKIKSYIDEARSNPHCEILVGGRCDDSVGYFVEPTVILTQDPKFKTMCEEIFGPVVTIYVYEEKDRQAALELCDTSSPYALTGAVFATSISAIDDVSKVLRNSAGNFYINDKPTGAVVGQQPFGGARASGTNDKAGSPLNLYRWLSPRTIKQNFAPPKDYRYPFMEAP